jgi:hypothetical protein
MRPDLRRTAATSPSLKMTAALWLTSDADSSDEGVEQLGPGVWGHGGRLLIGSFLSRVSIAVIP